MALEPLRQVLGARFINAGVAESNMVSVAAAMASEGFCAWAYSIAPFCYARPFEQIRNDICHNQFAVTLVGNGGGYAYGSMGASHHALEDYGILLTLPFMDIMVPAFDEDLSAICDERLTSDRAAYLRLGYSEKPEGCAAPPFAPWRLLLDGDGPAIVAVGPLAGSLWAELEKLPQAQRPQLWCWSQFSQNDIQVPDALVTRLTTLGGSFVEEHVAHGGAGSLLLQTLAQQGSTPASWQLFCARGYPSGRFGSQKFHRGESGLVPQQIIQQTMHKRSDA